jgi:hypothetical protein
MDSILLLVAAYLYIGGALLTYTVLEAEPTQRMLLSAGWVILPVLILLNRFGPVDDDSNDAGA